MAVFKIAEQQEGAPLVTSSGQLLDAARGCQVTAWGVALEDNERLVRGSARTSGPDTSALA
jgi:hypothetical protein